MVRIKRVPFVNSGSMQRSPSIFIAICLQMGSPKPSPVVRSRTSWKGLKMFSRISSGMTGPVLETWNWYLCTLRLLNSKRMCPPSGVCSTALLSRWSRIWVTYSLLSVTLVLGMSVFRITPLLTLPLIWFKMSSERACRLVSSFSGVSPVLASNCERV